MTTRRSLLTTLALASLSAGPAAAQDPYQPFGVDAENLALDKCNHDVGCPLIDQAAQAGAQWMRLFPIWHTSICQP